MSLKRFAIIAPLSYHTSNHNRNKTTFTPLTEAGTQSTTTAIPSTIFWTQQQQPHQAKASIPGRHQLPNAPDLAATSPNDNTATTTSNRNGNHNDKDNKSGNNGESNVTIANAIITYYGGSGGLPSTRLNGYSGVGSGGAPGSGSSQTYPNTINGNVNLLLGGAMLSLVTTVLCIVCYCCHRSIKKRTEAAYRQQRQWLENDPNMEIYSVEQCYETSGLFLGESTDGLATLATLHHEPPPSYDAVVAMQEQQILQQQLFQQQQQQQLLQLQHNSPPPGYRSTLDVRDTTTTMTAAADVATTTAAALIRDSADSNGNLSGSSFNNFPLLDKQVAAQSRHLGSAALLNMKKVLSAQSCCSLQRAEVENMWNAAAAAVAARAAHPSTGRHDSDNSNGDVSLRGRQPTPPLMLARKSLPLSLPSKLATVNAAGRRYPRPPHTGHHYRRGCPLCGKFRYDAENTLAMSRESGLDSPPTGNAPSNDNNNADNHACTYSELWRQQSAEYEHRLQSTDNAPTAQTVSDDIDVDEDGCACSVTTTATSLQQQHCAAAVASTESSNTVHAGAREQSLRQDDNQFLRQNAVSTTDVNDNINNNVPTTSMVNNEAVGTPEPVTAAATPDGAPNAAALDTINANAGIIRVDMSKIIDPSGLPTYEAALKLESSGYV